MGMSEEGREEKSGKEEEIGEGGGGREGKGMGYRE